MFADRVKARKKMFCLSITSYIIILIHLMTFSSKERIVSLIKFFQCSMKQRHTCRLRSDPVFFFFFYYFLLPVSQVMWSVGELVWAVTQLQLPRRPRRARSDSWCYYWCNNSRRSAQIWFVMMGSDLVAQLRTGENRRRKHRSEDTVLKNEY